jgi:ribonuclease III
VPITKFSLYHLPFIKKTDNPLIRSLSKILGFKPKNATYYELALRHPSVSIKDTQGRPLNNERLELLGDAVLELIVTETLYRLYPDKKEGFLSEMRSKIVCRNNLDKIGEEMGMAQLLLHKTNDNSKNIYGNALESILGAIFLDAGYEQCYKFVQKELLDKHLNIKSLQQKETNYKALLLQWGQKHNKQISFTEKSPTQTQIMPFIALAWIDGEQQEMGCGYSKRESQQEASKHTLNKLHIKY